MNRRTHQESVVFFHAHPDDEAIFTGGTIALLADAGVQVYVVIATSGEYGLARGDVSAEPLAEARRRESSACCRTLGASKPIFLGFEDSGRYGEHLGGFAYQDPAAVAKLLARTIRSVADSASTTLVGYDSHGIYDHPDHVQVNRVSHIAGGILGLDTVYDATVDREYLHFVETHVVVGAGLGDRPTGIGLAATALGEPTLLIDTTIDVGAVLHLKRKAMSAHESQLPSDAPVFSLGESDFDSVYGYEWYLRHGPRGILDWLNRASPST